MDFPNGLDKNHPAYADSANWSNQRWAWEFLRRNIAFRKSCHSVKLDSENEALMDRIAKRFRLLRFVDYNQRYISRDEYRQICKDKIEDPYEIDAVIFTVERTHYYKNTTDKPRKTNVRISANTMLVEVDLISAAKSEALLESQLNAIRETVKFQLKLQKSKYDQHEKIGNLNNSHHLTLLRLADAHNYYITDKLKNDHEHKDQPNNKILKWLYALIACHAEGPQQYFSATQSIDINISKAA